MCFVPVLETKTQKELLNANSYPSFDLQGNSTKKFRCNTVEEFNNRPENSRNKKCPTNLKDVFQFFGHPINPCKASLLCA